MNTILRGVIIGASLMTQQNAVLAQAKPTLAWVNTLSDVSSVSIIEIKNDPSGNVILAGDYYGTVDFDPGSGTAILTHSTGSGFAFVAKYTSTGDFIWAKEITASLYSTANSVDVDNAGNVYLAGSFVYTADLDPGSGVTSVTTFNNEGFMVKLNSSGNLVYAYHTTCQNSSSSASLFSIRVNSFGEAIITGYEDGQVDFDATSGTTILNTLAGDYQNVVIKLTTTGTLDWVKDCTTPFRDIEVDADNQIVLYALTYGGFDIDPGTGTIAAPSSATNILYRLDYPSGNLLDYYFFNSSSYMSPSDIAMDQNKKNVFLFGTYDGTIDFDLGSGTLNLTSPGITEDCGYIAKFNFTTGTSEWAKNIGGDSDTIYYGPESVYCDMDGNVYAIGSFEGVIDVDPGTSTVLFNSDNAAGIIVKLDSLGNYRWAYQFADLLTTICSDASENLYLGGLFYTTVDFDLGPGTASYTNIGSGDAFVTKWKNCDLDTSVTQTLSTFSVEVPSANCSYQWFDCVSGGPLSGETNSNYTATVNGVYQVSITNGTCVFYSDCYSITNVGLDEPNDNNLITMYPNPTNNELHINTTLPMKKIGLYNVTGKLMAEYNSISTTQTITLTNYPSGIYWLHITTEESQNVYEIIKE